MRNLTKEELEAYNQSLENLFEPTKLLIVETQEDERSGEDEK